MPPSQSFLLHPRARPEGSKMLLVFLWHQPILPLVLDLGGLLSLKIRQNVRRKVVDSITNLNQLCAGWRFPTLKKTNLKWVYPSMIGWFVIGMLSGWFVSTLVQEFPEIQSISCCFPEFWIRVFGGRVCTPYHTCGEHKTVGKAA